MNENDPTDHTELLSALLRTIDEGRGAGELARYRRRCYSSPMPDDSMQAADRWAGRALLVVGFLLGGIVGVFVAPDWQGYLEPFGVDQLSFRPAIPIILCCAIAGAYLAWSQGRSERCGRR